MNGFNYWIEKAKQEAKAFVKLKSSYGTSIELKEDVADLHVRHGLNLEAELTALMAKEICQEIDREILSDLKEADMFREEKPKGNFWLNRYTISFDKLVLPQFTKEAQLRLMKDAMVTYRLVRAPSIKATIHDM